MTDRLTNRQTDVHNTLEKHLRAEDMGNTSSITVHAVHFPLFDRGARHFVETASNPLHGPILLFDFGAFGGTLEHLWTGSGYLRGFLGPIHCRRHIGIRGSLLSIQMVQKTCVALEDGRQLVLPIGPVFGFFGVPCVLDHLTCGVTA